MSGDREEDEAQVAFEACLERSVHRVQSELGLGLTEAIYRNALAIELRNYGHQVSMEVPVPVWFEEEVIGTIRADLVVTESMKHPHGTRVSRVIELKKAAKITMAHATQAKAYLKRSPKGSTAHVINFGPEDVGLQTIDQNCAERRKRAREEENHELVD